MDENLVGYVLNALEPDAQREVEAYLHTHPAARQRLEMVRQALQPLAADRDIEPPSGLRMRTLARVAEYRREELPRAPSVPRLRVAPRSWWRRADVLVAASLLLLSSALILPSLAYLHHRRDILYCQNNLQAFYVALMTYSQNNGGALPKVDKEPPYNFAGVYIPTLYQGRYLKPEVTSVRCPANGQRRPPDQVTLAMLKEMHSTQPDKFDEYICDLGGCYAYTLGYVNEAGELCGVRRTPDHCNNGLLPIMADKPPFDHTDDDPSCYEGNSGNHGGMGQNVLYLDGSYKFCTQRTVGVNGNDIYLNLYRRLEAGVNPTDSVLAASGVHPCPLTPSDE
jgi:hypothetical protein